MIYNEFIVLIKNIINALTYSLKTIILVPEKLLNL